MMWNLEKDTNFRIKGFSVPRFTITDHPQRRVLMERQGDRCCAEVKELERPDKWSGGQDSGEVLIHWDPQLLEMKLKWKKKGKDIVESV